MLQIKDIAFTLALEDEVLPLHYEGKSINRNSEIHMFSDNEKGISAAVSIKTEDHIIIAAVKAEVKTQAFRDSKNFRGRFPVRLEVSFPEMPSGYCALYQHRDWWSRPAFLTSAGQIPAGTLSLLTKGKDGFGCILPITGDKTKTYINGGTKEHIVFEMTAYTEGISTINDSCFLIAEDGNLYDCLERVFRKACELKKIPLREQRIYPEPFEYLGWCSWDAFYTDITKDKVLEKVKEFKEKKLPVKWLLLDDGWLSGKDQCLGSFCPDPAKFPDEFKSTAGNIKKDTGISWIGVWHAIGGYWGGIAPDSELAEQYKESLYRTKNGKLIPHYDREKGYGFWKGWYAYLKDQGIDFVKVDGQSALKNYYKSNEEIAKAAAGTHRGLEKAVNEFMNGNIINCMGMAAENVFNRPFSCIARSSDDFVPETKDGFCEHLLQNAYNALYQGNIYVCDWDMFWTKHPDAQKHSLVRAISGGPVYISDKIGDTAAGIITPLIYHDGRILRMDRCAMPAADCIFDSPAESGALKLTNTVNGTGAVAAFNINSRNSEAEVTFSPSDIYDLTGEEFGAYNYFERSFRLMKREEKLTLRLAGQGYSLMLFLPLGRYATPIGLIDKYMSAHAVKHMETRGKRTAVTLEEGGIFAFYKAQAPVQILVNGRKPAEQVTAGNGFYQIDLSDYKEEITVVIE